MFIYNEGMRNQRRQRNINFFPEIVEFKPVGARKRELQAVEIEQNELEALRLKHSKGLDQEKAAEEMDVSRTTFLRDLHKAERKITDALIYGKLIILKGGDNMPKRDGTGNTGGRGLGRAQGVGLNAGQRAGGSVDCECPKCGEKTAHTRGVPCTEVKCPKCGTKMRGVFCK